MASLFLTIVVFCGLILQTVAAIPPQTALYSISLMVVAGFTVLNTGINSWQQWAQRRRDERLAIERQEVAKKAADVAIAATKVAVATREVKDHLDQTDLVTATVLTTIAETTKATHIIVNSEKTKMMEDFTASRLLNLTMAEALLSTNPTNESAKKAVTVAQTLYNQIIAATKEKVAEDIKSKQ